MKSVKFLSISFLSSILLILSACSSTPVVLPEKYNLADVSQVEWFYVGARNDVNKVTFIDEQSVTVETVKGDYLLVLKKSIERTSLCHYTEINLNRIRGDRVQAGHDRVSCKRERPVSIERIYEFENKTQKNQIVAQLQL